MLVINKACNIGGTITVPGDKSISHRAIMLASISKGTSRVEGFLSGQDCISTINCFRAMGIEINQEGTIITIKGQGLNGLKEPKEILDAGNSGTTMRLMTGILGGQKFLSIINGDTSLNARPMTRVVEPIIKMGAQIDGRLDGRFAPLAIRGGNLHGVHWESPIASAQVKSAVLFAGIYADGETSVLEPIVSRDHTERMLKFFGANIESKDTLVTVKSSSLYAQEVKVPGDISSAAFFMAAAAACKGAKLKIKNVGLNPTRTGIIDVLSDMGADITIDNVQNISGEIVGDIIVIGQGLKGVNISKEIIPRLIDEIPIIAVVSCLAEGKTVITGAEELKVKESNRLAAVITELNKMGATIIELVDGMEIVGPYKLKGVEINSYRDHRIAMAMAIAGLFAEGETRIVNSDCIDISFPNFNETLKQIVK